MLIVYGLSRKKLYHSRVGVEPSVRAGSYKETLVKIVIQKDTYSISYIISAFLFEVSSNLTTIESRPLRGVVTTVGFITLISIKQMSMK